jgi:hypothetical protein
MAFLLSVESYLQLSVAIVRATVTMALVPSYCFHYRYFDGKYHSVERLVPHFALWNVLLQSSLVLPPLALMIHIVFSIESEHFSKIHDHCHHLVYSNHHHHHCHRQYPRVVHVEKWIRNEQQIEPFVPR